MKELPKHCVNLKAFRTNLGMSYSEFSRELGISVSLYWYIENGKSKPTYKFLEKLISKFPEINLDDIL